MSTITLDIESSGLDWQNDVIHLCGWRVDGGEIHYGITKELKDLLSTPTNILRGHNIKFDSLFLANNGCPVTCNLEDTRVLAYLNWPEEASHSLKALVRTRLRKEPTDLSSITFKPSKKEDSHLSHFAAGYYRFSDGKVVRKDLLEAYHREDILNVDRLYDRMTVTDWFKDVEMPLTKILFEMELYGCPLDIRIISGLLQTYGTESRILAGHLQELSGCTEEEAFNPNSPDQIREVLTKLGHNLEELCEKTPKGKYQVDKPLLKELSFAGCEFSKTLLEYRKFSKIISTYLEPFIENSKKDGHLHGSINQAGSEDLYGDGAKGTITGRLSSSNPNLQNIPSRTKEGKEVRKSFISSEGFHMFDSDLKQIEPRLVAHYTQAPKLLYAYSNGLDTHGLFAGDIFGTSTPTALERFIGKSSWLATVYGCSYKKLLYICNNFSDQPLEIPNLEKFYPTFDHLDIDEKRRIAKELGKNYRKIHAQWMFFKDVQDKFKAKNPEIFDWRENHIARTRRLGYVITLGGRKITIDGLYSSNFKIRSSAERACINFTVQGSAADVIKMITVRAYREFVMKGYGHLFAIVHDELLGDVKKPEYLDIINDIMGNTCALRGVKIEADSKLVTSWGSK